MQTATIIGVLSTVNVPTSFTILGGYVVPASTGAVITHLALANKSGASIIVSVTIYTGSADIVLVSGAQVGVGDTLMALGENGRIVLQAGYSIRVLCTTASACDASMSVTQFV